MCVERTGQYKFTLFLSFIIASSLVAFTLCLAAEFKKSKKKDLILDGKLCYLPGTSAFELGITALICISLAQVIGTLLVCRKSRSSEHGSDCSVRKPTIPCILLVFSWISFGIVVILISTATSMSRTQPLGEGWLDGECYLVKNGVYAGSAVLALLALGSTVGSGAIVIRRKQAEEHMKEVHAQANG